MVTCCDLEGAACPLWASAFSRPLSGLPRDLGVLQDSQPSSNPHRLSFAGHPDHLDKEI